MKGKIISKLNEVSKSMKLIKADEKFRNGKKNDFDTYRKLNKCSWMLICFDFTLRV